MVSKNQIKLITSLHQKKYRNVHGLFMAEGVKVVNELLSSGMKVHSIYVTEDHLIDLEAVKPTLISERDLKKISTLKTPNKVVAVFEIPTLKKIQEAGLILVLDTIRDPGNLGTIIRLCDWFGVRDLVCSYETVDCYNPKVVQASMGSLARINVTYTKLEQFLDSTDLSVYAAVMDGDNVYETSLPASGILVMGNEAIGISKTVLGHVKNHIAIPRYGDLQQTESLNVATATAILLSEFRRTSTIIQK
ncbi:RNA methyltransferase [Leptobacterium sp. I13]|uniref:TrmH family RNA methyltransferase n=1 Tax=Leptobacterium meishanense TaxID=3128904 RepID=UPI0030ECA8A3